MSLDSLIGSNSATLQMQSSTADNSGGMRHTFAATSGQPAAAFIQDAKADTKKSYASQSIDITSTIITYESRGRAGDRWADNDGTTYYLIKGIRTLRGIGGIETYYQYDCTEKRLN